jgi:hypothetical protein
MSSDKQFGQRKKGGMLDIGNGNDGHPPFYLPFKKRHYQTKYKALVLEVLSHRFYILFS